MILKNQTFIVPSTLEPLFLNNSLQNSSQTTDAHIPGLVMYLQKRIRPVNLPEIIERIQNHPVDKGGNHSQKSILLPHRMQKRQAGNSQNRTEQMMEQSVRFQQKPSRMPVSGNQDTAKPVPE